MSVREGRPRGVGAAVVFVVDDDASVCQALSSLLRSVGWQVQSFASAAEFLAAPRADLPACVVLDVQLPDTSGLELQRMLVARGDTLPIIFITSHGDIPMSVEAMKAGALEFLPKPFGEEALLDVVQTAVELDAATRRDRTEMASLRHRMASLTPREHEVMLLVLQGMLNKQAAAALGIAEVTIKVHRRRVMHKMDAHSLPELVRMVERVQRKPV